MRTQNRMQFIKSMDPSSNHNFNNQQNLTKEDRLRAISMSKVDSTQMFDELLNQAIERQNKQKQNEEFEKNRNKQEEMPAVTKDDMFASIDKELGF